MPHETDSVISFPDQSGLSGDPLTTVAREGARQLIAQALEAELAELPEAHHALRDDQGRQHIAGRGEMLAGFTGIESTIRSRSLGVSLALL